MRHFARVFGLLTMALLAAALAAPAQAQPAAASAMADLRAAGAAIYQQHCAACHNGAVERAPPPMMLGNLSPEAIQRALNEGVMREQAAHLAPEARAAVAQFLAGRPLGQASAAPLMCEQPAGWFDLAAPPALTGWGLDAGGGHSIPSALAGIDRANVGQLRLQWAFAFPNVLNARSQPALAGGAIFVGSDNGTIYALDRQTGCAHWTYDAGSIVRGGIVISPWAASDPNATPMLFFGDQLGNAFALDAASGALIWKRKMDANPHAVITAAPALWGETLIVPISSLEEPAAASPAYACCTFRGSIVALNARTGAESWRTFLVDPPQRLGENAAGVAQYGPSGVAVWSTPLVDSARGQVIINTGDNYSAPTSLLSDAVVALDLATGAVRWAYQATEGDAWNVACEIPDAPNCPEGEGPDFDFGAAPVLARASDGRDYVLAGQKSGAVYAIDPASGAVRWVQRLGRGGTFGGVHFGIAAVAGRVFVPMSDFPATGWDDQTAQPGLSALDVATGEVLWRAPAPDPCAGKDFCHPGYGAAISVTEDLVLAGSTDGYLRIYDAASGAVLWEMDTDIAFSTVNGATGDGGSFSGAGAPLALDGQLIVNSGYGSLGKLPGNVLLVFGIE